MPPRLTGTKGRCDPFCGLEMHQPGELRANADASCATAAELERLGHVNGKGRRFDAAQVARLIGS